MSWKAPSRGDDTGLITKLAQANIDEVAPVDDEILAVRDGDPGSAPLRQRLASSTMLRVREVTDIDTLAGLAPRARAVVMQRRGLSVSALHAAVAAIRMRCPEVAVVVLDDQGGVARKAVAEHAGADRLMGPAADWKDVGDAVLEAAGLRARERAVGDTLAIEAGAALLGSVDRAEPLALLVLRVDNLPGLAGRHAGGDVDSVVLAVAVLVRPLLRPADLMARTDDDCLLIARRDGDELAVAALADRLLLACRHLTGLGAEAIPLTAAVGIAIRGPGDELGPAATSGLLAAARGALVRAQSRGRSGYELADPSLQARVTAQRQTEVALRHALDNHEFRVFYQPVVELADNGLTSFEALMRWQRPQAGLFDAGSFVGAAQRSGLMTRIGQTILLEAAAEASRWSTSSAAPAPSLSVNLSPQEYHMPTLVSSVGRILKEAGLQPDRLLLEIPFSLLAHDPVSARSILRDLAGLGVTLVADDCDGALSDDLRRLPVRIVKLRMGLLDQIDRDQERRARVAAAVSEVRAAGWLCVGKGVETPTQAAILRDLGCQGGQGFLFSGARPAEELALFRGRGGVWAWTPRAPSQAAV